MSNDDRAIAAAPHPSGKSSASRTYDFAQVDVFSERPLEGNALAIFTDARGLSSEEMQAIARETNLSETTFILPRAPEIERERRHSLRRCEQQPGADEADDDDAPRTIRAQYSPHASTDS